MKLRSVTQRVAYDRDAPSLHGYSATASATFASVQYRARYGLRPAMGFVGNLLLFAALKESRTDKVIANVRVAPFC